MLRGGQGPAAHRPLLQPSGGTGLSDLLLDSILVVGGLDSKFLGSL